MLKLSLFSGIDFFLWWGGGFGKADIFPGPYEVFSGDFYSVSRVSCQGVFKGWGGGGLIYFLEVVQF